MYARTAEMMDDVYYTSWMDRKPVAVLHTFPTKMGVCSRMVTTTNGGWGQKEYTRRPTILPLGALGSHTQGATSTARDGGRERSY